MVQFTFRDTQERVGAAFSPPDLVWQDGTRNEAAIGFADFVLASDDEAGNLKGLRSTSPIETAILIQLFTDARDDSEAAEERRGWFGDVVDIDASAGEGAIGSHLWRLQRAALTSRTGLMAESYARVALQPLVNQGLVGRFDISHEIDEAAGMLALRIVAVDASGDVMFNRQIGVTGNV